MLIIIPASPVEIITEQDDLFRKIFRYIMEDSGQSENKRRNDGETKETKINDLRENSRKWKVMYFKWLFCNT